MDFFKTMEMVPLVEGEFLRCGHCSSWRVYPAHDLLYGTPVQPDPVKQRIPPTQLPHPSHLRCGSCGQQSWVAELGYQL